MSLIYRLDSLGSDIVAKTEQVLSPGDIYYAGDQPIGIVMSSVDQDGYAKIRLNFGFFFDGERRTMDIVNITKIPLNFAKTLIGNPEGYATTSLIFADYLEDQGDENADRLRKAVNGGFWMNIYDNCLTVSYIYGTLRVNLTRGSLRKCDMPKCQQSRTIYRKRKPFCSMLRCNSKAIKLKNLVWTCDNCYRRGLKGLQLMRVTP